MSDDNENRSAKTESEPDAVLTERIGNTTYCIGLHFKKDTARQYGTAQKAYCCMNLKRMKGQTYRSSPQICTNGASSHS